MTDDTTDAVRREMLVDELERERTGFRYHAIAYVIASVVFLAWDVLYVPEATWAHWPTIGWGAGLAAHYFGGVRCAARRLEQATGADAR